MLRNVLIAFLLGNGLLAPTLEGQSIHHSPDTTRRFDPETMLLVAERTNIGLTLQYDPKVGLPLIESSVQSQPPPVPSHLVWDVILTTGLTYRNSILSRLEQNTLYVVQGQSYYTFRAVTTPISVQSIKGLQQRKSMGLGLVGGILGGILGFYTGLGVSGNYESSLTGLAFLGGIIGGAVFLPEQFRGRYDFSQMTTDEKHTTLKDIMAGHTR